MISEFFAIYILPTGRRSFALKLVVEMAKKMGDLELEKEARRLLTKEAKVRGAESAWATASASSKSAESAELRALDADVDRCVSSIKTNADTRLHGLPRAARKSKGPAITEFVLTYFPNGVTAITHISYPEEYEAVTSMMKAIRAQHPQMIPLLGIAPFLSDLDDLLPDYLAAIKASGKTTSAVAYKDVQAVRAQAHEDYCLLLAKVLASGHSLADRAKLLAPIVEQNTAMSSYYVRRAVVQDVDAESGEVVASAPQAPAAAPPAPDGSTPA